MQKIKNILSKIWPILKKKRVFIPLAIVIIVVLIILLSGGSDVGNNTFTVQKGEVVSEVSVTGQVKPSRNVDVAFERSGRISSIRVKVGDKVYQGQTLVAQENGDFAAQLAQAQAQLKSQQAKLEQLKNGSRPEDVRIKEIELAKAKEDLAGYYNNSINVINDAFSKSNDAVIKQTDDLFTDDNSSSPKLSFEPSSGQFKNDSEYYRSLSGGELIAWASELNQVKSTGASENILEFLNKAKTHTDIIRKFLNILAETLNKTSTISPTVLTAYRTSVNTALTNVNTAATSISTQIQTVSGYKLTVQKIENELALAKSGARPEDITYQEGQVDNAKASVDYAQSQLAKTVISSPFSGTVTKVVPEVGDIVQPNSIAVSVIGSGKYQMEVNITESDITKVKINNQAKVTLDAYGSAIIFEAKVVGIDLSETIIEGVATYKTILQFKNEDERILPGLTANIDILNDKKEDVLYVPTRNITTKDGNKFVMVVKPDGTNEEIKIETGLRGSDGRTEILSGINEGTIISTE
ncbi:MAG: efflux RND transporter periplasmic adaptor subunit [Candidatus Paceibacterota bacterium]